MKTPEQYIKQDILLDAIDSKFIDIQEVPDDMIFDLYDKYESEISDMIYEYREGHVETHISTPYSRHYESRSVAVKMRDGTWVGWTYWYGGGKHAEPEAIPWMNESYFLDCKEEEKLIIVQTFTLK